MSIHDIASSLQRKIRSDFPLYMLSEKNFNIENFLLSCYSTKSKDLLETSKALKKDLENFLESTEKSLSQHITQDFDKLISIPSLLLSIESEIADLCKESSTYSTILMKANNEAENTVVKVVDILHQDEIIEEQLRKQKNLEKINQNLQEINCKMIQLKDLVSLPINIKLTIPYGPIIERISKLLSQCEELIDNNNNEKALEISRIKTDYLRHLEKELILYASQNSDIINFISILESYKNLGFETEAQIILRESVVYPIVKKFLPKSDNLLDDSFNIIEFFDKILVEFNTGKFIVFRIYADYCDILVKSFLKAVIKVLSLKGKIFSPVFSQDYQLSLIKSIEFTECVGKALNDYEMFRNSSDFSEFLEKWNLPTFFELRKTEIIKPLMQVLKAENITDFLALNPSGYYIKAIEQCLESIIIPEMYPKFLRLLFQITSTYSNFITRNLNSQTKTKGISIDDLVNLVKDIQALKTSISIYTLIENVKLEIETILQQLIDPCIRGLIESISKMCINNLESIKTIPSLYKMTNRAMPFSPSSFASSFFQPLKLININDLPKEKIVNKVILAYIEIVQETKNEIAKVAEMIEKYNPDSQDCEKMRRQLDIDKGFFLEELNNIGFTSENNELINQIL
ncbi:hypothetical protein SteCoe_8813 [Stentor coeruleus]|uniref:COG complex component COG2 C-terminal domain-containing protein n=1 Tax=Stentor coeruleus TaxID=5963 RepID=A0A1R2CJC2_9CILI|nr:hypothetical protein SteCoe_8813 [Stentor coeruleus]